MNLDQYTPIRCAVSKDRVFLYEKVKSEKGYFGTLVWDDYLNRYVIRTENGGVVYARTFEKVDFLKENNFDTTNVECRSNPRKKRW